MRAKTMRNNSQSIFEKGGRQRDESYDHSMKSQLSSIDLSEEFQGQSGRAQFNREKAEM